jgi:acyl-coenzyme A thioesterase PaaI-like protein
VSELEHCFGCGQKNPVGLKLVFGWDGEEYVTTYVPRPEHQSYGGVVHGGLLATVLDETMGRMLWEAYGPAYTAELRVRYLAPVRPGARLECRGRVDARKGRAVFTSASLCDREGELVRASATYIVKGAVGDGKR